MNTPVHFTTKRFVVTLVLILLAQVALAREPVAPSVFLYLEIAGISGASTVPEHKDQIELLGVEYAGLSPTRRTIEHGDVSITKYLDKATPKLYEACAKGTHIAQATVYMDARDADGMIRRFFRIKMQEVIISSVKVLRPQGDGFPVEEVSLNFGSIELCRVARGAETCSSVY